MQLNAPAAFKKAVWHFVLRRRRMAPPALLIWREQILMWVFALGSPFVPAEGFCWSEGRVEEDSSITRVHPHGSSVWQTMQCYNAAGDRRKRRVSGSVSDTEVKIQTSSRQRQLAAPQPAPSPPPPPASSLAGLAEKLHKCTKTASIDSSAISWRYELFIFLQSLHCVSLFTQTPFTLMVRSHA